MMCLQELLMHPIVVGTAFITILIQTYIIQQLKKENTVLKLHRQSTTIQNKIKKTSSRGDITLIGCGPGDPDLLTRAAWKAIEQCNLVITDRLISKQILDLVPKHIEIKVSKKYKGRAQAAQEELHQWMIKAVDEGKSVVRLKGGDPFVYGRGGEEVVAMNQHGYPIKVIPGISSVLAAPLAAGIPVTSRNVSDRLVILSGHCKRPDSVKVAQLKKDSVCCVRDPSTPQDHNLPMQKLKIPLYESGTTLVFLMSIGTLAQVREQLLEKNTPVSCPVAMIERATNKTQRVTKATVETMVQVALARKVASPATVIVGDVVNCLSNSLNKVVDVSFDNGGVVYTPKIN